MRLRRRPLLTKYRSRNPSLSPYQTLTRDPSLTRNGGQTRPTKWVNAKRGKDGWHCCGDGWSGYSEERNNSGLDELVRRRRKVFCPFNKAVERTFEDMPRTGIARPTGLTIPPFQPASLDLAVPQPTPVTAQASMPYLSVTAPTVAVKHKGISVQAPVVSEDRV